MKSSALPLAAIGIVVLGIAAVGLRGCRHDPVASTPAPTASGGRTSSAGSAGRLPKGSVIEVRVVGVTDGDTVKVLTSDKTEIKMRLNGIDAPESKMPYGTQAKLHLSDLVFDKTVTAKIEDYDRYGRAVGRLTLGGDSVNARMVLDGYAWWYRTYAPKDHELEADEAQARSARRGLWSQSRPQKPWEWRKAKRERSAASSEE